ncbi:MAG: hypothetical protein CL916_00660 [Deltaproteobacteria bacterium]|nr:hypothetical protein [Deltaproteobacteria bacterium]
MIVVDSTPVMRKKLVQELVRIRMFSSLDVGAQAFLIDNIIIQKYEKNEVVFRQGDPSDTYLVLLKGRAKLEYEAEPGVDALFVGTLGRVQGVGELGLITGKPRALSLVANDPVLMLTIKKYIFMDLFDRFSSFSVGVARELAQSLERSKPKIPLAPYDKEELPDESVLSLIPMSFILRHRVLPLRNIASRLTVGFVDPFEAPLLLRIKNLLPSMQVNAVSIKANFFNEILKGFSGGAMETVSSDKVQVSTSPIILSVLLHRVVSEGASDLHLSAGLKPRWRVDGEMIEIHDQPVLGEEDVLDWIRPMMREDSIEEFVRTNDVDFAIPLDDIARFRVNVFRDQNGFGAVFRLIPSQILSVQQLGLPNVLLKLASLPKGLVLVTGPTGSGKSTTLAAMIDYINKTRNEHIITLEDPIEFVHTSRKCLVNQREIGPHTDNFSRALRAALRQDPDIVLVGELRDLETIQLAIEVANTGHLVFGTLHTATAITTVDRMVDMFPANQQNQIRSTLSEVLQGVVSQTLLKKRGGGRIAAIEVLIVNNAVANLIRESKTSQVATIMQTGKARGNCMLNDSLADLVLRNEVAYEEALNRSMDKSDLARRLNKTYNPT